jgi:hypothetical protein
MLKRFLIKPYVSNAAACAYLQMTLWTQRCICYASSKLTRKLVLNFPTVKPKRSTQEMLTSYQILNTRRLAPTTRKSTVYAVALWLDNIASDDERSCVMGLFALLGRIRDDVLQAQINPLTAAPEAVVMQVNAQEGSQRSQQTEQDVLDALIASPPPLNESKRSVDDTLLNLPVAPAAADPPAQAATTSSTSSPGLWKIFRRGLKSTARAMSADQPNEVELSDLSHGNHALDDVEGADFPLPPQLPLPGADDQAVGDGLSHSQEQSTSATEDRTSLRNNESVVDELESFDTRMKHWQRASNASAANKLANV